MNYEFTDNDHLINSMKGGLYEAEPPNSSHSKNMLNHMIDYFNALEINFGLSFNITETKLIDNMTGIALAERNQYGEWIVVEGWLEALNNA